MPRPAQRGRAGRIGEWDRLRVGLLDQRRDLSLLDQVAERRDEVAEEPLSRRDLDVIVPDVAPDWRPAGVSEWRREVPREDGADGRQDRVTAPVALRVQRQRGHVGERLVGLIGAVLEVRDVVSVERRQAHVLPAASIVDVEADVLGRPGEAEAAPVTAGQLDLDRRLEQPQRQVVADAGELLVLRLGNDLLYRFERAVLEIAKVVGIGQQECLEVLPFLRHFRNDSRCCCADWLFFGVHTLCFLCRTILYSLIDSLRLDIGVTFRVTL